MSEFGLRYTPVTSVGASILGMPSDSDSSSLGYTSVIPGGLQETNLSSTSLGALTAYNGLRAGGNTPYLLNNQNTSSGFNFFNGSYNPYDWNWKGGIKAVFSPIGEGKNAMSLAQMGLGLYAAMQQNAQFKAQLEEARKQHEYHKALTGANFQTQATGVGDRALHHALTAKGFSEEFGNQVAANYNAGLAQLNDAGNRIGINNVVGKQQDQLRKYNALLA